MDYVVAGFGIGAILALIGFALWELYGTVEEPETTWQSRAAIGLMLGALVIWSVTAVSLVSHIEDSMGSQLVLLTTLVALVAIAGGTFWYWRADRALAATRPRPANASVQREVAVVAEPMTSDIELTEWDSWPDRGAVVAGQSPEPVRNAEAAFEPEVAIDAQDIEVDALEPAVEQVDAAEPEAVAPDVIEREAEIPTAALPSEDASLQLPEPPSSDGNGESVEVLESDAPEPVEGPAAESVEREAVVELVEDASLIAEEPDQAAVDQESDAAERDDSELPSVQPSRDTRRVDGAASGFESSLLSDIDGSLADQDGAYRSPLLADLGADQLEGVGLAKWRPEARLDSEQIETMPPPSKSGRRR